MVFFLAGASLSLGGIISSLSAFNTIIIAVIQMKEAFLPTYIAYGDRYVHHEESSITKNGVILGANKH